MPKMKKLKFILYLIPVILLISCVGSDTYRGAWKATDGNGTKFEIIFDAKSFSLKDSTGVSQTYHYIQNSINISNGVETYGIQIKGGAGYQINFPIANDESVGLIKDVNGQPMYTISRKDYVKYEDVFKLN